jgi:ABC-type transport system substrate-binding protein
LAGLIVAGLIQVKAADDVPPDIDVAPSTTLEEDDSEPAVSAPSTSVETPFVYRIGILAAPSTDNFWAYYGSEPSVWNSYVLGPTKPTLFSVDAPTGSIQPELAVSTAKPTWNEEGWRVVVDLDHSLSWSDGEPVTAHDVAFTFEVVRALALDGSWATAFPPQVRSVEAADDDTVLITFTEQPTVSVWPHGVGLAPVMPRHVWGEIVAGASSPTELYAVSGEGDVSGGPLAIASSTQTLVISHANPGYGGTAGPDTVEYHVYADEASAVAAVAAGEIDTVLSPNGIAPEHLGPLADEEGVAVISSPANGTRYLGFNLTRAPMSNKAFRHALALLIDREGLAGTATTSADAAWSVVPAGNKPWYDENAVEAQRARYTSNPSERLALAIESLTAVGYAWEQPPSIAADGTMVPGTGLTIGGLVPQPLTILTPGDAYDPTRPEYVDQIARTLGILGFDARPVETDFDTVVDLAFTKGEDGVMHYDMYLLGWTLGNPALPGYYRPFFASDGAMNNTGYASPTFTEALAAYEAAFTTEEAKRALWAMEMALWADLPYLPLYTSEMTEVYRSDRVRFDVAGSLDGLSGRLGGIGDVRPAG